MPDRPYAPKRVLVTIVDSPSFGDRYLHANATIVTVDPTNGDVRRAYWDWRPDGVGEYADLVFTGQLGSWKGTVDQTDFYGREVIYKEVYSAKLIRVEAMVKVLRKVERHLEKAEEKYGTVDWAGMIPRLADAVGADQFGIYEKGACFPSTGTDYRWGMNTDNLRAYINRRVDIWKALHGLADKVAS